MTRINYGILPKHLPDKLLLAEHREIKRVPKVYEKALKSGSINKIPESFTLGTGHVLYFIDKPSYTYARYIDLYRECISRGFKVENYSNNWYIYKLYPIKDTSIKPNHRDIQLIIGRIIDRVFQFKYPILRYGGQPYSKWEFINLLKIQYGKQSNYNHS